MKNKIIENHPMLIILISWLLGLTLFDLIMIYGMGLIKSINI
jgi:hypothetical protein